MEEMLKVKEFAELCGTTRKTLYHYERIGLLRPTIVGDNEYRYYSVNDCFRFFMIRALADSGFTLEQATATLKKEDASAVAEDIETAQAMVDQQIAHLEQQSILLQELRGEMERSSRLEPGVPVLVERPEVHLPVLLRTEHKQEQLDSLAGFPKALANLKRFAEFDPAVLIAAMANSASIGQFLDGSLRKTGAIVYDMLLSAPVHPVDEDGATELDYHVKQAGTYVELYYRGSWEHILHAYKDAIDFAHRQGKEPVDRFYEIPDSWLFDMEYRNHVQTTVTVRVE